MATLQAQDPKIATRPPRRRRRQGLGLYQTRTGRWKLDCWIRGQRLRRSFGAIDDRLARELATAARGGPARAGGDPAARAAGLHRRPGPPRVPGAAPAEPARYDATDVHARPRPPGDALVDATVGGFVKSADPRMEAGVSRDAGQRPPPVEEPDDSENAVNRSARGRPAAPAAEHPVVSAHHGPRGPERPQ
jgi:hypothetical protein